MSSKMAASTETMTGLQLPTSSLAHIASFLSLWGGDVQNVLVAAPAGERRDFRELYLHDSTSFLSQAVLPLPGGGDAITHSSILRQLKSASTRLKINMLLNTSRGAKILRESAGSSAMVRPYTLEADDRCRFHPSRAVRSVAFAIAVDNPDLLKWAMEAGSLDPNGYHDDGLIVGEDGDAAVNGEDGTAVGEGDAAVNLLCQCIFAGSTECFEWLLAHNDGIDPNVPAASNHSGCVLAACINLTSFGRLGNGVYFLRRLLDHPATDANRPLAGDELTPLWFWACVFGRGDFPSDRLEDSLRVLNCLVEGGASVHRSINGFGLGRTPYALVKQNARSGGPEHRARHILALELMGGGDDAVSYLLEHGNSADVAFVHGAATSALKLGMPPSCVDVKFFTHLVWAHSFFPTGIQRRLNDFIFVEFLLVVALTWCVSVYFGFRCCDLTVAQT